MKIDVWHCVQFNFPEVYLSMRGSSMSFFASGTVEQSLALSVSMCGQLFGKIRSDLPQAKSTPGPFTQESRAVR
jgi:hypothetical protein